MRRYVVGAKLKSRDKSFGWCTSMTATEHVIEDEIPPLGGTGSRNWFKQVRKCASNGTKWLTKNQMVLGPRRRK
jgi:hypothetical protein